MRPMRYMKAWFVRGKKSVFFLAGYAKNDSLQNKIAQCL